MICPSCGNNCPDNATFCTQCGTSITVNTASTAPVAPVIPATPAAPGTPAPAPQVPPQATPMPTAAMGSIQFNQSLSYISSTGSRNFVTPDEIPLYSLKNGNTLNSLTNGLAGEAHDAVITNKRLYYYHRKGTLDRSYNEKVISLEDVSGVRLDFKKYPFLIFLGVLLIFAGIILSSLEDSTAFLYGLGILGAIFIIIYFFAHESVFIVDYSGGNLTFDMDNYTVDQLRTFSRCIFAAKEVQKEDEFKRLHRNIK